MASLLLVEDHPIVAKTLARILHDRGNIDVTAIAPTAEDALQQVPDLNIDLALVDVSLPNMSGIEFVAAIKKDYPNLPCLMLSGHTSAQYVQRSLAAGARGYVIKDNFTGILEGIERVLQGEIYISEELQEQ